MISNEQLKEFALTKESELGYFPKSHDWLIKNGYPVSGKYIGKTFGSYSNFREFCGTKVLKRTKDITIEWFKNNCSIVNDCWEWQGSLNHGYGELQYNNSKWLAHRLSYTIKNGVIQDNLLVRHICHNKACCNPDHLMVGTKQDNSIDSREYSKNTKLTQDIVRTIKQDMLLWDFTIRGNKIKFDRTWSEKLNVSISTIGYIRTGKLWKS